VTVLGMRPKDAAYNDGDGPITVVYTGVVDEDEGPITAVYTGVPRAGDPDPPEPEPAPKTRPPEPTERPASCEPLSALRGLAEEPAGPHVAPNVPSRAQPAYIRATIRNEPPPGEIAEGWYAVHNGAVELWDHDHRHLGSRPLPRGEDPAGLARQILRETAGSDFNRPIHYPGASIA
jgi:hypothetical protein